MGIVSCASAFLAYPAVSNFLHKIQFCPNRFERLLPSSCSEEEISKQAHLIVLYSLLYSTRSDPNKYEEARLQPLFDSHSEQYKYIRNLRKLVLKTYTSESAALSRFIEKYPDELTLDKLIAWKSVL